MYKLIFLAVVALFAVTEASRYARLQTVEEPAVYCNPIDLITCVGEIESAFEDCSHAGSADDIFKCIEEIIGAGSDCLGCVCDIIGIC